MYTFLQTESIKLWKNFPFWVGLCIFAIGATLLIQQEVIYSRVQSLSSLLDNFSESTALSIIFLSGFIPTLIGQEIRYNGTKLELLAGYSRWQKLFINMLIVGLYCAIPALLYALLAVFFLIIDGNSLQWDTSSWSNWAQTAALLGVYGYVLNTVVKWLGNTGLTIMLAFIYYTVHNILKFTSYAYVASALPLGILENFELSATELHENGYISPTIALISTIIICFSLNILYDIRRDVR